MNLRTVLLAVALSSSTFAAEPPRLTCQPVAQRSQEVGCWILASESVGLLKEASGAVYWHLYAYPTRSAADAAKRPGQTVVESLGRVWLMTVAPRSFKAEG